MRRILLLLENKENRRLLAHSLKTRYEVIVPDVDTSQGKTSALWEQSFDLCILCGVTLESIDRQIQEKKCGIASLTAISLSDFTAKCGYEDSLPLAKC